MFKVFEGSVITLITLGFGIALLPVLASGLGGI